VKIRTPGASCLDVVFTVVVTLKKKVAKEIEVQQGMSAEGIAGS